MLPKFILVLTSLGFAAATSQYRDLSCGQEKPDCSQDMTCVPQEDDCTDLSCCPGYCTFKNQYKSCGGLRPEPVCCGKDTECIDDPRTPDSCGMACDAPGICAPKEMEPCGGFAGFTCPDGLYCYYPTTGPCVPSQGGRDCLGFCL